MPDTEMLRLIDRLSSCVVCNAEFQDNVALILNGDDLTTEQALEILELLDTLHVKYVH